MLSVQFLFSITAYETRFVYAFLPFNSSAAVDSDYGLVKVVFALGAIFDFLVCVLAECRVRFLCHDAKNVKMSKPLKPNKKRKEHFFLKTDSCAKLRKLFATCAKLFKKSDIFFPTFAFTMHGKIWVIFSKNKGMGMEFDLINV